MCGRVGKSRIAIKIYRTNLAPEDPFAEIANMWYLTKSCVPRKLSEHDPPKKSANGGNLGKNEEKNKKSKERTSPQEPRLDAGGNWGTYRGLITHNKGYLVV